MRGEGINNHDDTESIYHGVIDEMKSSYEPEDIDCDRENVWWDVCKNVCARVTPNEEYSLSNFMHLQRMKVGTRLRRAIRDGRSLRTE